MRLIDADDFKKFLQALCKAGAPYSEVIQLLDRQETVYDVEKVVAGIEKQGYEVEIDDGSLFTRSHTVIDTYVAIAKVRKGGVE